MERGDGTEGSRSQTSAWRRPLIRTPRARLTAHRLIARLHTWAIVMFNSKFSMMRSQYRYAAACFIYTFLQHTKLSDEKSDDGQCWPKYLVFFVS